MELGFSVSIGAFPIDGAANQGQGGDTPGVEAQINIIRRSRLWCAPEGVVFEVAVSGFDAAGPSGGAIYDDRFHDLYYFWDFGDAYTFSAPQNLPPVHRNANVAYGPMASHTYRAEGIYTVSVLVVEPSSGKQATATLQVPVGNPDAQFPGLNTLFVSPSSDWTNAPAGAGHYTSFDAAIAAVLGNDAAPRRILLNRGENHTFSGAGLGTSSASRWPTCHIMAGAGTGARPVVSCTGGFYWDDTATTGSGADKDFVLQGIDFVGPYSSVTNSGTAIDLFTMFQNAPQLLLLDQVSMSGFGHAIFSTDYGSSSSAHRTTVLNDSVITDFQAWGFADYDKFATAITGCSLRAHVDALVDSTPNMGAPLRSNGGKTIVHSCDGFSRQGWSPHGDHIATQPSFRLNAEGVAGAKIVVAASAVEGGHEALQIKLSGVGTAHAVNALIEKNYMVGGYQTYNMVSLDMGGVTVRNNVMVWPDTGRLQTTNDPSAFVRADSSQGDGENQSSPIRVYSNTMVNLLAAANHTWTDQPAARVNVTGFTAVTEANNVEYQPNLTSPVTGDAPLATSPAMWVPREKGYRTSSVPLQSQTATPPGITATYAPLSGSDAIGDALAGPVARDDFDGDVRPQYPSRGAFEMP